MTNTTKQKFKIDGMHCSACAMNIDFDLEDLEGVKTAKTNYAKCVCEVEFDPQKLGTEEITKQIHKTGYKVLVFEE